MESTIDHNLDGRPETHVLEFGKPSLQPLQEQLFDEEWLALQEMKKACPALCENYSDEFVMACLFSRKMNQKRAIELLEKNWKWRQENNFVEIPNVNDLAWHQVLPQHSTPGVRSKDGYLVIYASADGYDPDKVDIDKAVEWSAWFYLRGQFFTGMDVARNGIIVIQDLGAVSMKHLDMRMHKAMFSHFQDNFPLRLKRNMQLNAPGILRMIVTLIRPFVSKKIMNRIGTATVEEVTEVVGKENLWSYYGGDIESNTFEWIVAVAQYMEHRFNEKLESPVTIRGHEIVLDYPKADSDDSNTKGDSKKVKKNRSKKEKKEKQQQQIEPDVSEKQKSKRKEKRNNKLRADERETTS